MAGLDGSGGVSTAVEVRAITDGASAVNDAVASASSAVEVRAVAVRARRGRSSGRLARRRADRVRARLLVQEVLVCAVRDLGGRHAEAGVVEFGEGHEVDEGEDRLGEDVQDAVCDHFGRRWDHVATIGDAPLRIRASARRKSVVETVRAHDDGVHDPDEAEVEGAGRIALVEVGAEALRRAAAGDEEST